MDRFGLPLPGAAARRRRRRRPCPSWPSLIYSITAGYRRVCEWIPVLLLLDIFAQTYGVFFSRTSFLLSLVYSSNSNDYSVSTTLNASADRAHWTESSAASARAAAISLLLLFVFVLSLLLASLATMWWESWVIYHPGFQAPSGANFGLKPVMQAVQSQDLSLRHIAAGNRPSINRYCVHRSSGHLDRMHPAAAASGRNVGCLPSYDHWCFWLWVPVCLTTTKAYLLSMVYILVFHTVSTAVLAWSFSLWGYQNNGYSFAAACLALPCAINWVFVAPIVGKWQHLGFRNSPGTEWTMYLRPHEGRQRGYPMCVRSSDGAYHHRIVTYNPWDLGTMGNLRQVLGDRVWMWPFAFLLSRAVQNYGQGDDSDLPFSEDWLTEVRMLQATPADVELGELPRRQRHLRSSSG